MIPILVENGPAQLFTHRILMRLKVEEKIKMRGRKSVIAVDPIKQDQPKVRYRQILKACTLFNVQLGCTFVLSKMRCCQQKSDSNSIDANRSHKSESISKIE